MNTTASSNFSVIKDNYTGEADPEDKKENKDRKKIIDDDFLGDLKAIDVPDSDDEMYFWAPHILDNNIKIFYM